MEDAMMKKNMFVCCTALVLCCRFFTGCQMETKPPSVFELAKETEERAEQQRKLPEVPTLPVITASNSRLTVTWRAAERAEYYEVFMRRNQLRPNHRRGQPT
jgi:hypothetical protein